MSLPKIEKILYHAMGLNSASIGSSAVLRSVEHRMLQCNITDINIYSNKIVADKFELQELVEEVVVAETWFFRDKRPFQMLTDYIIDEWLPSEPSSPVRLLSLPCATGEEPYSIAITLLEAGLMPSQLKIDAFDISEKNIKRCLSARYRENSFRGVTDDIKNKFFHYQDDSYHPDILIKAMVNFDIASILDLNFINIQERYDVVFCRNLLIYFDKKTQTTATEMLAKLLKKEGLLFVGHAETSIFSKTWYMSNRYPKSYVMRKINDAAVSKFRNSKKHKITSPVSKASARFNARLKAIKNITTEPKKIKTHYSSLKIKNIQNKHSCSINVVRNKSDSVQLLKKAQQFADSGELVEAEEICLRFLESNKNNIQVYYLLAIIQLASGDAKRSAGYFKNVVYLDPNHYEALMYLSTLSLEQGDEKTSTRYRERAIRIQDKLTVN